MLRNGLLTILALFISTFTLSARPQGIQSSEIHYYLNEYTDEDGNKVAIIFEIASDDPTAPGSGFQEVSIEELQQAGYEPPSETEKNAYDIDKGSDPETDNAWSSYFQRGTTSNNYKWVKCGSKTSRSWYNPGSLFVACTTYRWVNPGGARVPVYIREHLTWGYYTYVQYYQEYRNVTYGWNQKGRHHWGDPSGMRYSSAGGIW